MYNNRLIEVKEEALTEFSKGWQGFFKNFPRYQWREKAAP